jgi:hypothetical protein
MPARLPAQMWTPTSSPARTRPWSSMSTPGRWSRRSPLPRLLRLLRLLPSLRPPRSLLLHRLPRLLQSRLSHLPEQRRHRRLRPQSVRLLPNPSRLHPSRRPARRRPPPDRPVRPDRPACSPRFPTAPSRPVAALRAPRSSPSSKESSRGLAPAGGPDHRWCATSTTRRDPLPGPRSLNTRNGSLARTPTPNDVMPSNEPAQTTCRSDRNPVTSTRWRLETGK